MAAQWPPNGRPMAMKIVFSAFLMLFLGFANGQITCSPFEFEITPVDPILTSGNNSPSSPSAFQAYYKVRLKGIGNNNLPNNWQGKLLQLSGQLSTNKPFSSNILNGFTSRINVKETMLLNTGGVFNANLLTIASPETGAFTWIFGDVAANSCSEYSVTFGAGMKSVELFTIVVDAVPGETISLVASGHIIDCNCNESVLVKSTKLSGYNIVFAAPAQCSNTAISFDVQNVGFSKYIFVNMSGIVGNANKFDGVIHIEPQMNGIVNLEFNAATSFLNNNGVLVNLSPLEFKKRKNTDGSFDIYFFLPAGTAWTPTASASPQPIFYIELLGQYNQSQGGNLLTSLSSSRVSWTSPTPLVCSPLGLSKTIVISGNSTCQSGAKLSMLPFSGSNCTLGVEYRFDNATPVTFKNLKLKFWLTPANMLNLPNAIVTSSNLSAGALTFVAAANGFGPHYEFNFSTTSNITIDKNTFVQVPFNLKSDCINYYVITAEGTQTGSNNLCSFPVLFDLTKIPACNPEITGTIRQSNGHTSPQSPSINLLSANSNYNQATNLNCPSTIDYVNPYNNNASYSFCPNPLGKPFQLWVPNKKTDWLYGVNMFDVVLMSKHVLNVAPFTQPYQFVAGNVGIPSGGTNNAITTYDIVELRKLILGIYNELPSPDDYPSWRYFRKNYVFPTNPLSNHPYNGPTPAPANFADVNNQPDYGDFVSVKLGDVNFSGNCGGSGFAPEGNEDRAFNAMDISGIYKSDKNQLKVDFYKNSGISWIAAQSGIRFDANILNLSTIVPNEEIPIKSYDFNKKDTENGEIRFGWATKDGVTTLAKNPLLFSLLFEVKDIRSLDMNKLPVWLAADLLPNLSFDSDGHEFPLIINERQNTNNRNISPKIAVMPNPTDDRASIKIMSEVEGAATMQIAHLQGGVHAISSNLSLVRGENSVELDTHDLTNGLYLISVKMPGAQTVNYRFSVIHH
jgi:hypothetical protein